MDSFFKNAAEIFANLPDNPLAIASLIAILLGVLAVAFFYREPVGYKMFAFISVFLGCAGLIYVISLHDNKIPNSDYPKNISTSSLDSSERNSESDEVSLSDKAKEKHSDIDKINCPSYDILGCGLEDRL